MNAIDELGYTARALFLMNERHNQLGQMVEDGLMPLADFRAWKAQTYESAFSVMAVRKLKAKKLVRSEPHTKDGDKSDYDGKKLSIPDGIKSANKRETYAYMLKLQDEHKTNTISTKENPIDTELDKSYKECQQDTTFDAEIRGSDGFKVIS